METTRDVGSATPTACREAEATAESRVELVRLLLKRKVPDKDDIIRTKSLIRELANDPDIAHPAPVDIKDFIAAYLDLYVGRITADPGIERPALRQCLSFLGVAAKKGEYKPQERQSQERAG